MWLLQIINFASNDNFLSIVDDFDKKPIFIVIPLTFQFKIFIL